MYVGGKQVGCNKWGFASVLGWLYYFSARSLDLCGFCLVSDSVTASLFERTCSIKRSEVITKNNFVCI